MKKRFSEEQIIGFLREAEAGMPIKDLCRRHGFSEASYYLWRSKFGGMNVPDAKRLKDLEAENARLKKLLAPDQSGLAPALVYLAGYDPLYDEGLAYADKLMAAGHTVLLLQEPGMTHDFMRMSGLLEEVAGIHARVAGWLDEQLLKT